MIRRLPTPTQPRVFFRNREGRAFDLLPDTIHKFSKRYTIEKRKVLIRRLDHDWVRVIFVDPPDGHVEIRARVGSEMTAREAYEIANELVGT